MLSENYKHKLYEIWRNGSYYYHKAELKIALKHFPIWGWYA